MHRILLWAGFEVSDIDNFSAIKSRIGSMGSSCMGKGYDDDHARFKNYYAAIIPARTLPNRALRSIERDKGLKVKLARDNKYAFKDRYILYTKRD